ncbi:aldo/keto reductase [Candidatus Poribacteria bacterium]|nr:aldo/keto reductase [Candidatus Poribacteria bacterium]
MEIVALGKTGLNVSRLSIGTGSNGWNGRSNQTDLGFEALRDLLLFSHEKGVTFWDSADQYGSHPHVKAALQEVPRESVTVTTKTTSRTRETVEADVKRFLKEIDSDYVDIVLLHCLTQVDWPQQYPDAMEALARCKEQGLIRAHGVSCHDYGAFQTSAMTEWVDVVLARINHAGVSMDASPADVIRTMEQMAFAGKGIYGMKVLGQGKLAENATSQREAIEFVMGLPCVHAMTIGMTSENEVEANVAVVNELSEKGM